MGLYNKTCFIAIGTGTLLNITHEKVTDEETSPVQPIHSMKSKAQSHHWLLQSLLKLLIPCNLKWYRMTALPTLPKNFIPHLVIKVIQPKIPIPKVQMQFPKLKILFLKPKIQFLKVQIQFPRLKIKLPKVQIQFQKLRNQIGLSLLQVCLVLAV